MQTDFELTVTGDVHVEPTGAIYADGRGFPGSQGPGAGGSGHNIECGGGGHGGAGARGDNVPEAAGGPAYGDPLRPTTLGSGGGNATGRDDLTDPASGGSGGGVLLLSVGGVLRVDGLLSAVGTAGNANWYRSGGGAGGSIRLHADTIAGDGAISANGGAGGAYQSSIAGGGGGGRIVISTCDFQLPLAAVTAVGTGVRPGDPGTIRYTSSAVEVTQQPASGNFTGGDAVVLHVQASTSQSDGNLSYQWRRNGVNLADGDFMGTVSGTGTDTLTVQPICADVAGEFDVLVTDSCGAFPSDAAHIGVVHAADWNGDLELSSQDFFEFLAAFFKGNADFNEDGVTTSQDFFGFLTAFFSGC
jgi:hypothetical protein